MTPPAPRREKVRELHYDKGLTPREIATVLGISTQAVYKHLKALELAKATAS